ncbi:MAG TPA: flavodoxin domain-containing protein [Mycobacteriales bacterium]|nr:flavodoxin domain-containing protein [Mycobacteriales bacterium]
MHALVVYESMFGNTERVAKAIAAGLGPKSEVDVVNVDDAPRDLSGIDLLVVGGPTHIHGMSRPATRKGAADQAGGDTRSRVTGMREWIGSLGAVPTGTRAAVFDTRLKKPRWITGSAAGGARKLLRRGHFVMSGGPESFFVTGGTPAELLPGESARAEEWGRTLASVG